MLIHDYNKLLKELGGYVTLDADGRVMRYTNQPVPTGLEAGKKRFSNPDEDEEMSAHVSMEKALRASRKFAALGYSVDCLRGELLGLVPDLILNQGKFERTKELHVEPAAFVRVWKWVDALDERKLCETKDQMLVDCSAIGGDYFEHPGVDKDPLPFWWQPEQRASSVTTLQLVR